MCKRALITDNSQDKTEATDVRHSFCLRGPAWQRDVSAGLVRQAYATNSWILFVRVQLMVYRLIMRPSATENKQLHTII